jgi:hypothetical protein
MGLLEYHAIPSLRDVVHDGVLCTFSNRSAQRKDICIYIDINIARLAGGK